MNIPKWNLETKGFRLAKAVVRELDTLNLMGLVAVIAQELTQRGLMTLGKKTAEIKIVARKVTGGVFNFF